MLIFCAGNRVGLQAGAFFLRSWNRQADGTLFALLQNA
jgi:hypothetical protein